MNQNVNENIINPVYEALIEYLDKSSIKYKKHMFFVETGEQMDIREKGGTIIESFPWPIGKELSRLFSAEYAARDKKRLLKIYEVTERVSQFLSFCWLIILWEAKKQNSNLKLTADFKTQSKQFFKPSVGIYLGLIRASSNMIFEEALQPFFDIPEIETLNQQTIKAIDKMVMYRNNEFHFKAEITCEEAEQFLGDILKCATYLVKYPLISVRNIQVEKSRFRDASFKHSLFLLNSQRADFSGEDIQLNNFSDSHSVMLIQDLNSLGKYLNLSPLVIDTKPYLFNDRGINSVMAGPYMFIGKSGQNILYTFINGSEIHPLKEMPQFNTLSYQWDDIIKTLEL